MRRLPKRDLERFRRWFAEYDAAAWDQQLERDLAEGRLDKFAREALQAGGGATADKETCTEPPRLKRGR